MINQQMGINGQDMNLTQENEEKESLGSIFL